MTKRLDLSAVSFDMLALAAKGLAPARLRLVGMLATGELCVCQTIQIRTLSSVIREQGITRVDFLKIDVEGSEISVLDGIEKMHWPIFKQIAVETHSAKLQEQVCQILAHRNFEVYADPGLSVTLWRFACVRKTPASKLNGIRNTHISVLGNDKPKECQARLCGMLDGSLVAKGCNT